MIIIFSLIHFGFGVSSELLKCPTGWIGRHCNKVIKPKWVGIGRVGNDSIELSWRQKTISKLTSKDYIADTDNLKSERNGFLSKCHLHNFL